MRVPEGAGLGLMKFTLSFPAWKEGNVRPYATQFMLQPPAK